MAGCPDPDGGAKERELNRYHAIPPGPTPGTTMASPAMARSGAVDIRPNAASTRDYAKGGVVRKRM